MTILVDDAVWPWRGERWAHLVSDVSLDELHVFANRLGVRRLAFQDDHYDVPAALRTAALARGASAVSSRALVGALRAAGLRARGPRSRWVDTDLAHPDVRAAGAALAAQWPLLATLSWTTARWRPGELALSTSGTAALVDRFAAVPATLSQVVFCVVRGDVGIVDAVIVDAVPAAPPR